MLAERRLLFLSSTTGAKLTIKVAIGAPRHSESTEGFEHLASCKVHTGTETAGEHDVYGVDLLQALSNGLTTIEFYLKALATQGRLTWENGDLYKSAEALFPGYMNDVLEATMGSTSEELKQNIARFLAKPFSDGDQGG